MDLLKQEPPKNIVDTLDSTQGAHLTDDELKSMHELCDLHFRVLSDSISLFNKIKFVPLILVCQYALRGSLFVLYLRTFTKNDGLIAVIVDCGYIGAAFASVFYGYICDKYGKHDYLLIAATLFDVITFFIDATTESLLILAISVSIGTQPANVIYNSWTVKYLPVSNATQIGASISQYGIIGFILGPIFGGIIVHLASLRAAFYFSAILQVLLFIYCLIFFGKSSEKKLQLAQNLIVKSVYNSNIIEKIESNIKINSSNCTTHIAVVDTSDKKIKDNLLSKQSQDLSMLGLDTSENKNDWIFNKNDRFPIANIVNSNSNDSLNSGGAVDTVDMDINNISTSRVAAVDGKDGKDGTDDTDNGKPSRVQLLLIFLSVLISNLIYCNEFIQLYYYTVYMNDKYNQTVLISILQLSIECISLVFAAQFVKILDKKYQNYKSNYFKQNSKHYNKYKFDLTHSNWLVMCVLIASIIGAIFSFIIIPNNDVFFNLNFQISFWFWSIIMGIYFGLTWITQDMVLLLVMPSKMAGKVYSGSSLMRYVIGGTALLSMGILWEYSHEWFFYLQGILYSLTVVVILVVEFVTVKFC